MRVYFDCPCKAFLSHIVVCLVFLQALGKEVSPPVPPPLGESEKKPLNDEPPKRDLNYASPAHLEASKITHEGVQTQQGHDLLQITRNEDPVLLQAPGNSGHLRASVNDHHDEMSTSPQGSDKDTPHSSHKTNPLEDDGHTSYGEGAVNMDAMKHFMQNNDNCVDLSKKWFEAERYVSKMLVKFFHESTSLNISQKSEISHIFSHRMVYAVMKYAVVTSLSKGSSVEEVKSDMYRRHLLQPHIFNKWLQLRNVVARLKESSAIFWQKHSAVKDRICDRALEKFPNFMDVGDWQRLLQDLRNKTFESEKTSNDSIPFFAELMKEWIGDSKNTSMTRLQSNASAQLVNMVKNFNHSFGANLNGVNQSQEHHFSNDALDKISWLAHHLQNMNHSTSHQNHSTFSTADFELLLSCLKWKLHAATEYRRNLNNFDGNGFAQAGPVSWKSPAYNEGSMFDYENDFSGNFDDGQLPDTHADHPKNGRTSPGKGTIMSDGTEENPWINLLFNTFLKLQKTGKLDLFVSLVKEEIHKVLAEKVANYNEDMPVFPNWKDTMDHNVSHVKKAEVNLRDGNTEPRKPSQEDEKQNSHETGQVESIGNLNKSCDDNEHKGTLCWTDMDLAAVGRDIIMKAADWLRNRSNLLQEKPESLNTTHHPGELMKNRSDLDFFLDFLDILEVESLSSELLVLLNFPSDSNNIRHNQFDEYYEEFEHQSPFTAGDKPRPFDFYEDPVFNATADQKNENFNKTSIKVNFTRFFVDFVTQNWTAGNKSDSNNVWLSWRTLIGQIRSCVKPNPNPEPDHGLNSNSSKPGKPINFTSEIPGGIFDHYKDDDENDSATYKHHKERFTQFLMQHFEEQLFGIDLIAYALSQHSIEAAKRKGCRSLANDWLHAEHHVSNLILNYTQKYMPSVNGSSFEKIPRLGLKVKDHIGHIALKNAIVMSLSDGLGIDGLRDAVDIQYGALRSGHKILLKLKRSFTNFKKTFSHSLHLLSELSLDNFHSLHHHDGVEAVYDAIYDRYDELYEHYDDLYGFYYDQYYDIYYHDQYQFDTLYDDNLGEYDFYDDDTDPYSHNATRKADTTMSPVPWIQFFMESLHLFSSDRLSDLYVDLSVRDVNDLLTGINSEFAQEQDISFEWFAEHEDSHDRNDDNSHDSKVDRDNSHDSKKVDDDFEDDRGDSHDSKDDEDDSFPLKEDLNVDVPSDGSHLKRKICQENGEENLICSIFKHSESTKVFYETLREFIVWSRLHGSTLLYRNNFSDLHEDIPTDHEDLANSTRVKMVKNMVFLNRFLIFIKAFEMVNLIDGTLLDIFATTEHYAQTMEDSFAIVSNTSKNFTQFHRTPFKHPADGSNITNATMHEHFSHMKSLMNNMTMSGMMHEAYEENFPEGTNLTSFADILVDLLSTVTDKGFVKSTSPGSRNTSSSLDVISQHLRSCVKPHVTDQPHKYPDDDLPVVVLPYQPSYADEDKGILLINLLPVTGPVEVKKLPNSEDGRLEYKETQERSRKRREEVEPNLSDRKPVKNPDEVNRKRLDLDEDPAESEFGDGPFAGISLQCSLGWICAREGTILDKNNIIRFVPTDGNKFGLVQATFTSVDEEKDLRVGLLVYPKERDGLSEDDIMDEIAKDTSSSALLSTDEWNPIKIEVSRVVQYLHYDVIGLSTLLKLDKSSRDVQQLFDFIAQQRIEIFFHKDTLRGFTVQQLQKVVKRSLVKLDVENHLLFNADDELVIKSSSLQIPQNLYFFAKYQHSARWTRFNILVDPPLNVHPRYLLQGFPLPLVPFIVADNRGFPTQTMASKLSRLGPLQANLSIVVTNPQGSRLGQWQINCDERKWLSVSEIMGRADGLVMQPALFVSPSCMIRFQPVSSDTFWSADEARVNTKLKIKIWNVQKLEILPRKFDSLIEKFKETGVIVVDLCADEDEPCYDITSNITGFVSAENVVGYIERAGCDGVKSSLLKLDRCGVCGGRNLCVDCSGVRHGNASIDKCGVCSDGTTGIKVNAGLDCGGGCLGENYWDDCRFCQNRRRPNMVKDCAGKCFGDTPVNSCGACVVANTTYTIEDACGVCGGDNSTCRGCDGGINSEMVFDDCGACLNPDDPSFNQGCVSFVSDLSVLYPSYQVGSDEDYLYVILTGRFADYHNAACTLDGSLYDFSTKPYDVKDISVDIGTSNITSAKTVLKYHKHLKHTSLKIIPKNFYVIALLVKAETSNINVRYPVFVATVTCFLRKKNKEEFAVTFPNNMLFYTSDWPAVRSITPKSAQIGSNTTVIISGNGFIADFSYVCVFEFYDVIKKIITQTTNRKSRYISTTKLMCLMPASHRPGQVNVYVEPDLALLPELNSAGELFRRHKIVKFYYWETAPRVINAQLSDDLNYIVIEFDKPLHFKPSYSCSGFLHPDSVKLLGTKSVCVGRESSKVYIRPSANSKLFNNLSRAADEIDDRSGSDESIGEIFVLEGATVFGRELFYGEFPLTRVEILYPRRAVTPKLSLGGPTAVGVCDGELFYKVGKSIGNWPLKFIWTRQSPDGSNVTWTRISRQSVGTEDIGHVQSASVYTFHLQVRNVLGVFSKVASHAVAVEGRPRFIKTSIQGEKERVITASRNVKIAAKSKVLFDACEDFLRNTLQDDGEVVYNWSVVSSVGFAIENLKDVDQIWRSSLFIPRGLLVAGVTYRFIVTATYNFGDGLSSSDSAEVEVVVKSEALIARIEHQHTSGFVNSSEQLTLIGVNSFDPNQDPTPLIYSWHCDDIEGLPCVIHDPDEEGRLVRAEEIFSRLQEIPEVLSIPAWLFPIDGTYNFTLRVSKGSARSSQDSVLLTFKKLSVALPRIELRRVLKPLSVSRVNRFYARVSNADTAPINVRISWSSEAGDGLSEILELSNSSSTPITRDVVVGGSSQAHVPLVLKQNVLQPGKKYRIRIIATLLHLQADDVIRDVDFFTSSLPLGGQLEVDPPIGVTMTTAFTLRATGWFDPLSDSLLGNEDDEIGGFVYKFGYYKKSGAKLKFTLLVPFSQSSEISGILLPPPDEGADDVTVVMFVANDDDDVKRSFAQVTVRVRLNATTPSSGNDAFSNVNTLAEEALLTGNPVQAAALIATLGDAFSDNNDVAKEQQIQKLADDFTRNIDDVKPRTEYEALETLQSANDVYSRVGVSNQSKDAASSIPGNIMTSIFKGRSSSSRKKRDLEDLESSDPVLTNEMVVEILALHDAVLESRDPASRDMISPRLNFRNDVMEIKTQFCRAVAYFEPPLEVSSENSKLVVGKYDVISESAVFGDADYQVSFSSSVSKAFNDWMCAGNLECLGACVAIGIFEHNVVTWYDSEAERVSNVIAVALLNPESGRDASFRLPSNSSVTIDFDQIWYADSSTRLECRRWSNFAWWGEDCRVVAIKRGFDGQIRGITCSCDVAHGYYALFSLPHVITTVQPSAVTDMTSPLVGELSCIAPLVERKLCSSLCIPRCGHIAPPSCVSRCRPLKFCVCPEQSVFDDDNDCVGASECPTDNGYPFVPESWKSILIGCLVGVIVTIAIVTSFVLGKILYSRKQLDLVKPFNCLANQPPAVQSSAPIKAGRLADDTPPPYYEAPGCVTPTDDRVKTV
ncbi:unnamed protein product [Clavelina lepadiformis]|uniref:Uncharacterized protein n=1 Tax=Clavelina lepadiformis TaxID=159417 RepID=A0ABP0GN95_CLALP